VHDSPLTRRFPLELAAVWLLFTVVAAEILVTYSRLPPEELYHVSGSGFRGGASRTLVFLNFPVALVAIAVAAVLLPDLDSRPRRAAGAVAIVLCGVVFWPGVVKESDLDARWINALPAVGTTATLVLTAGAVVRLAPPRPLRREPWDGLRVAIAAAALALAVPWLAADLGLSFNGVPVLGTLYQSGELRAQPPASALHPAVHHGHHHGMDGVLLVLSALLLSRLLRTLASRRERLVLGAYLALMLSYGAANIANDFWLEQVVKRGWTEWQIPPVTTPAANGGWIVIVVAAAAVWAAGVLASEYRAEMRK
jgi:hypothetical protein